MSKTNSILGAWLALFCAIFWAGYLFGDTAPLFGNAATLALIVLWGIGNALITAYPALSLPYLITLMKRTRLHSLVIAGMITFVWGFHPWLMPIEVGIGITSVMLLIWSSLFLVYRPTQTLLLKIEDAPAWLRDNEGMTKTPSGWLEVIEIAPFFNQPTSTWFGERSHVIIPIYLGLSDQVKQAISQSAAQLKQTDHVYLGLFVDDVFEKGQKPLGFKTKPNRCLDDLESWLLHLTKNAKTEAEKEQIYLLGASVKPLIPIIEGLADKLNFCGILFFAAPKTHSPLAQLAEQCSFSQWQIDGAQTGHASVNEVVSTIEQSKHSAKRLMLKPALLQTGAAMILALPLAFLLFGLDRSPLEVLFKVEVAGNDELQGYWGDLVNVTWRTSHGTARLLVNGDSKAATGHYHFPLEQPTTLTVSVQTFLGKVLAEKSKQVRLLPSRIDHFKANFKQSTDSKCLASSTHDILLDWQVLGAKTVTLISGDEEKAVSQQETLQKSIQKSTPFKLKMKGVDENGQPISQSQVRFLEVIPPDMKCYESLFYVGLHEITAGQYQACMAENACEMPEDCDDRANKSWQAQETGIDSLLEKQATKAMGCLSVNDTIQYVNWRSKQEALSVCYDEQGSPKADCTGYRIPTKTEWENLVSQTATTYWQADRASCVDEKWGCEVSLDTQDKTAAGIKFLFTNVKEIVRNDDNNRYEAVGGSWIAKRQRQPNQVMTRPLRLRNKDKRYNDVGLRIIRSVVRNSEEEQK